MCVCVSDGMCCCGWVVIWGHDLRMGCYWASGFPPEPQPSLSSNRPPPPQDPHAHTSQATVRHASLTHPLLLTVNPLPVLVFFSSIFQLVLFVFFFLLSQCNMSTHGQRGECWCVNPLTGVQIPATPKVRGDPNCNQFQEDLRAMPTATEAY